MSYIDNSDMPILTEDDIRMFVVAYKGLGDGYKASYDEIYSWIYNTETSDSVVRTILKIPYENLPLYINNYFKDFNEIPQKKWHDACISVRLKIGK